MNKVLFPICTLTWRVNNYVSRQEKVYIGEMKVQKHKWSLQNTDDKISSTVDFPSLFIFNC